MWTKGRVANWLLISLIPNGVLGFVLFIAWIFAMASNGAGDNPDASDTFLERMTLFFFLALWAFWWLALIVGVPLRFWAFGEERGAKRRG